MSRNDMAFWVGLVIAVLGHYTHDHFLAGIGVGTFFIAYFMAKE